MTELSPILAELERQYDVIHKHYLAGYVNEKPVISLARKGRKRTMMGWYNPAVWSNTTEDVLAALVGKDDNGVQAQAPVKRAEICIATELLSDPVQTVAELARQSLIHTLVEYNIANGSDPAKALNTYVGANGYYPEVWAYGGLARKIDCAAEVLPEQQSRGWAKLVPNDEFKAAIASGINYAVFDKARQDEGQKAPVGSRMKKWTCGCTTVRCAIKLTATCEKCGKWFHWAEVKEAAPQGYRIDPDDRDLPNAEQMESMAAKLARDILQSNIALSVNGKG